MADIQPPPGGVRGIHKAPEPGDKPIFFRRELFTREGGTRNSNEDRLRRERGQKSEYVKFDENLNKQYRTYLQKHTQRLLDASRRDPQLFQRIRGLPDADVLSLLTSARKTADGKEVLDEHNNPILDVSQDKIQKFLEKSQGWEITTKMIEHETALLEFALALNHSVRPPAERSPYVDLRSGLPLNRDRGWFNVPIEDYIGRFMSRRVYDVAGRRRDVNIPIAGGYLGIPAVNVNIGDLRMWQVRIASTVSSVGLGALGMVIGGPVGAGIGVASPMAVEGLLRTMRGGLRVDVQRCEDAFRAVSTSQENRTYLREVLQFDLDDFQYIAANPPGNRVVRGRPTGRSRNLREIQKDILENLHTREEFYTKGLNVPENSFDSSPFQTVLNYAQYQQVERLDTKMQAELVNEWKPDESGIRDTAGLRPRDGAFNPGALDNIGNIRRLMDAQRKVLMKEMQEFLREELQERKVTDSKSGSIEILNDKKKEREGDGASIGRIKKERAAEITKNKETLTAARELVGQEKTHITAYRDAVSALRDARNEAQARFAVADIAGIDTAIRSRDRNLHHQPPLAGSFAARKIQLTADKAAERAVLRAARLPGLTSGPLVTAIQNIEAEITTSFQERERQLEEERTRINQEITDLRNFRNRIETSQRNLGEGQATVVEARRQLRDTEAEFQRITNPAGALPPIGPGIDAQLNANGLAVVNLGENDLRDQPVHEIFRRIAAANTAGAGVVPPVGPLAIGWSEAELKRPEIRQRVVRAIIEARARDLVNADPAHAARDPHFQAVRDPATWDISEALLVSYSPRELRAEMTRRQAANPLLGAPLSAQDAALAIQEAQSRVQARFDAMTQLGDGIEEQKKQQEHAESSIDLKGEIAQIDAAKSIVKRKDYVYEQAAGLRINRDRFTDMGLITGADVQYSPAERTANAPKGYYEIMDLLFGYKNRPDRGKYFDEVQKVLPPQKLAEILHDTLGYPVPVGPPPPGVPLGNMLLIGALNRMRTDMTGGRMSTVRLQRSMRAVVHRLEDEALALP